MANMYRKKLEKIYKKIDNIASKGKDNQLEYYKYINELIEKGDYSAFEEVLLIYYKFDVSDKQDISSYKKESWDIICRNTKSVFLSKLSKMYKKSGIYQYSFDVYSDETGQIIGQIKEKEVFSSNTEYFIKNKQFARLIGEKKTFLEVKKVSDSNYLLIDDDDTFITEENNLLNRYKTAIEYLLS